MLRAIVRGFNPQALPDKKTELLTDPLLEKLNTILVDNVRDGKENIVIIDEAHTIEDAKLFEQLRLILNFQLENRFLLSLLLFGQPELKNKVENIKPLDQRIALRCFLGPLSEDDSDKYIRHRIKVAGRSDTSDPIFDKEALKTISQHTGGIPRRINTLCDLALTTGFAKKAGKIEPGLINSVIKDFNLS